jgi:copper oxidase (laccase) domain-containing protein
LIEAKKLIAAGDTKEGGLALSVLTADCQRVLID